MGLLKVVSFAMAIGLIRAGTLVMYKDVNSVSQQDQMTHKSTSTLNGRNYSNTRPAVSPVVHCSNVNGVTDKEAKILSTMLGNALNLVLSLVKHYLKEWTISLPAGMKLDMTLDDSLRLEPALHVLFQHLTQERYLNELDRKLEILTGYMTSTEASIRYVIKPQYQSEALKSHGDVVDLLTRIRKQIQSTETYIQVVQSSKSASSIATVKGHYASVMAGPRYVMALFEITESFLKSTISDINTANRCSI